MKLCSGLLATGLLASLCCSGASAEESAYLNRFEGSWSGNGSVARNEVEKSTNVSCSMNGNASAASVSMSGTCRAAVVFSRKISADLRVDAKGRYSGTYVGSSIGPAALSGARRGDAVVLTITWPKPVRGDTTATMTIRNSGNGRLAITIMDEIAPGGPVAQVSKMSLSQS